VTCRIEPPCRDEAPVLWRYVGILAVAALVLALSSCATYAVVTEAPPEFWLVAESLIVAVLEDLWSIVDLFL
jgi:hypothetical protein